jgi:hypothetical protein
LTEFRTSIVTLGAFTLPKTIRPAVKIFALDTATELDDDMTKSPPVEMLKVLEPVIELDDNMTKSSKAAGLDIKIWA